jgi:uncharacterized protein YbaP (TraB family)
MKKTFWLAFLAFVGLTSFAQSSKKALKNHADNTLLWRISGKNIKQPSYLFGTMHMLCADDIQLSDSLRNAIAKADKVYLELDLDNMMEMMGAMTKMKMRNDTTLKDLLSPEEYTKVKNWFGGRSKLLPFNLLETYKPLLAASLIMEQQASSCGNFISMEQLVMAEAKKHDVEIKGLETMVYQMGIFDSIPYKYQAKQLLDMVENGDKKDTTNEIQKLTNAYRSQQLNLMEEMTAGDKSIGGFTEILLYRRNENWAKKLETLLGERTLLFAVGAGHLPGKRGVIELLRKAGYKVEPVKNEMIKKPKEAQG